MLDQSGAQVRVRARDVAIAAVATSGLVHAGLVQQHLDDPVLAVSFGAAAAGAAGIAFLLARPGRLGPGLAAAFFAALLVAYPLVHLLTDLRAETLDLATKIVETLGLFAALAIGDDREGTSLASFDVLVGILLAVLLLSALGHEHGAVGHHAIRP